jgi:hypothetical protein
MANKNLNHFRMPTHEELLVAIEEGRKNRLVYLEDRRRSCLSIWYPKIKDLVPTPRTEIVRTSVDLEQLWDHKIPDGYATFLRKLKEAVRRVGLPVFLRTGCGSAKHGWKDTCYLDDISKIEQHVYEIMEFHGMADLPSNIWVVREFLCSPHRFTAFYGKMPITKERRYFVKDGKVICHHPYWPKVAIEGQGPSKRNWKAILADLNSETPQEVADLTAKTELVGRAVGDFWSVDWLFAENNWYLTDMGVGEQSYHWPDCPLAQTI